MHEGAGPGGSLCHNAKCPTPHMLITTATNSRRAACWRRMLSRHLDLLVAAEAHTYSHIQTLTGQVTTKGTK